MTDDDSSSQITAYGAKISATREKGLCSRFSVVISNDTAKHLTTVDITLS